MKRSAVLLLTLACGACIEAEPSALVDAALACEFGRAVQLPVGGMLRDSSGGVRFCIESPNNATFALIPFVAGAPDTSGRVTVSVHGGGLSALPAILDLQRPQTDRDRNTELERLIRANDAAHDALRAREDAELKKLLRADAEAATGPAALRAYRVPAPGDLLQLNVAASCEQTDRRTARVVAVTRQAIVSYDPANPSDDPFTDDDLRRFGREFDDIVYPTITQNFGTTTDLDGNGRVILFFTRAVNEVVPPGGGAGLAVGFFYRGDVFPIAGIPGRTAPCPGSNEGEVLYLAIPDPEGVIRGVPVNNATLDQLMTGTIAHELQHLINASRRLHISNAPALEQSWLNEAMSHAAEELMFYASTGLTPGMNIDTVTIYAPGTGRTDAFNRFMYGNLGRFDRYIQAPQDASPMGLDSHETRGAAWSFLRYLADRDPRPDATLFRMLTDGPSVGLENLRAAIGQDPLEWMLDWSVSVIADDLMANLPAQYQQPSWNARNLISALRILDRRYPLRVLPVENGAGFSVRMASGAVAYPVFAVRAGERALVTLSTAGENSDRIVRTMLLRIK